MEVVKVVEKFKEPVALKVLKSLGVSRKEIRKLVRRGVLVEQKIRSKKNRQIFNVYSVGGGGNTSTLGDGRKEMEKG